MNDYVEAFRAAMTAAGLSYAGEIVPDGKLHPIKVAGDRSEKAWYLLHGDGLPAGAFGDHKRGISERWCFKSHETLTPEERAERDRKWRQQQAERDAEQRRRHDQARVEAQKILDAARPAPDNHPYLLRKRVRAYPGVKMGAWPQSQTDCCLLLPLRTAAGPLATVQAIFPRKPPTGSDKRFLKGGEKKGAYFALGDPAAADAIFVAEGYATAASIMEAAAEGECWCAIMGCDAANLKPVAEAIRALYPAKRIVIAADNDHATEGNPGLTKATAAAKTIDALLAFPKFNEGEDGSDFNDLAALRGIEAVREALLNASEPKAAKKRTEQPNSTVGRHRTIQRLPGELPENVDAAEAVLCEHEPNFYQRGGQLVRWASSRAETVRGIARPGGAIIILNLDTDYLLDRLNRLIGWERWDKKKEDFVACDAPRPIATTLLARRGHWRAKPLVAVIGAPTLRPDGSILDAAGYDETTGLLFAPGDIEFEPIPQNPTREQALAALAFIKNEVLAGFPFAADHDWSAALSAILTAVVHHSIKNAPMHTFNAPVMASGKSLLADVAALVATGHPATVMSYTPDGDEMRKRVLSVLMQGDLVVNLDNIEEPLASQTLCSVLTQESFTDRILGSNKTGTAPTLCCWLATGNNLVVAGDLTTRVVPCNLDPQVERPEEREFDRNLYDWIPANRPRLIREALTVLRAYVVAGRPKQPIKNFARFEDWSGLVRSALVWLNEADPLAGREALEDGDPVRVKLRVLLMAWYATFKSVDATIKEAKARAQETQLDDRRNEVPTAPLLRETLEDHFTDRAGAINSNAIGYFLRQHAGRIESGARFEAHGGNAARSAWRVVVLDSRRFKDACDAAAKIFVLGQPSQLSQPSQPSRPIPNPSTTRQQADSGDDDAGLGCKQGWDGCHGWDVSPREKNSPEKTSASPALS